MTFPFLQSKKAADPAQFVLLHSDTHDENTLKELSGAGFQLIAPDGIYSISKEALSVSNAKRVQPSLRNR